MLWAKRTGFTIVELLIVIVVIAILAAISVVAYNGIQARSQDAKRLADVASIQKALEFYKSENGVYPAVAYSGSGQQSGWEVSSKEASGGFLSGLTAYGFSSGVPVDPINNSTESTFTEAQSAGRFGYYYYRYAPGAGGCSTTKGDFYILGILRTGQYANGTHPSSPGIDGCTSAPWPGFFSWYVGKYTN